MPVINASEIRTQIAFYEQERVWLCVRVYIRITALYRSHQIQNSSRQEKCIIGNCNGRKNPEITEKHCVTKDYVLRSTYRNIFIILLHSVHYYLHSVLFMLFISVYLRVKTKDTC